MTNQKDHMFFNSSNVCLNLCINVVSHCVMATHMKLCIASILVTVLLDLLDVLFRNIM